MIPTVDFVSESVEPVLLSHRIDRAYVFGSVARGDADDGSDVDIRVERDERFKIREVLAMIEELEEACGRHVDLVTARKERLRPVFARAISEDEEMIYGV